MNEIYVSKKEALSQLGLSAMTLLNMANSNNIEYIRTQGGHRKYNVAKYINDNKIKTDLDIIKEEENEEETDKLNICYIRVSTVGQKDNLEHQREFMKNKFPDYMIIEDIGSGINFNRKGK